MSWDQLRQEIDKRFSLSDIRTLCFDLGIDYDKLAGEEKVGKVRELLLFVQRVGRENELITYLSSARPKVPWKSLLQAAPPAQPVTPGPPQPVTPSPAPQSLKPEPTQEKDDKPPWRPWGDFPVVVILGALASLITIFLAIPQLLNMVGLGPDPTVTTAPAPSAATTVVTPVLEPGAVANTAAAVTATSVFVAEGTRAAATATAAVAPTAQPTPIGGGTGKIAYVSDPKGFTNIYVVDVASGQTQPLLTDWEPTARRPVWSPDGSKILFNVTLPNGVDLYMANAKGRDVEPVTNNFQPDYSRATWAPDGQRIAFGTKCGTDNNEICVLRLGEAQPVNITNNPGQDYDPAWSPAGGVIAFVSERDGAPAIYLMNEDGTGQRRVAPGVSPVWSPDGTKLAFAHLQDGNYDIYVMNADGSNETRLTTNPARDASPAWSPDGTKIAFISTRDEPNGGAVCNDDTNTSCKYTIYYMDADGSNATRVTSSSENSRAPVWQPSP